MKIVWHLLCVLRWYSLANAVALSHNSTFYPWITPTLRHPQQTASRWSSFIEGYGTRVGVGWISWMNMDYNVDDSGNSIIEIPWVYETWDE
jgi:hypothetical protein